MLIWRILCDRLKITAGIVLPVTLIALTLSSKKDICLASRDYTIISKRGAHARISIHFMAFGQTMTEILLPTPLKTHIAFVDMFLTNDIVGSY